MITLTELVPAPSDPPEPFTDRLRLAVAAYLARFKGSSRAHTESDLRCYLSWCTERGLDPLAAQRPHLELYIRWMQEIRRFKPSTVSRRFPVAAGFYRTCALDGVLPHSPAEHVRRPSVPAESPTLGFTHLQGSVLGFVLERELELGAIGDRPALVEVNVLLDDLGHPQITERPGSGPDRLRCCVFP